MQRDLNQSTIQPSGDGSSWTTGFDTHTVPSYPLSRQVVPEGATQPSATKTASMDPAIKRQTRGLSCMGCYKAKQRCRGHPCSRCKEKNMQCVPQSRKLSLQCRQERAVGSRCSKKQPPSSGTEDGSSRKPRKTSTSPPQELITTNSSPRKPTQQTKRIQDEEISHIENLHLDFNETNSSTAGNVQSLATSKFYPSFAPNHGEAAFHQHPLIFNNTNQVTLSIPQPTILMDSHSQLHHSPVDERRQNSFTSQISGRESSLEHIQHDMRSLINDPKFSEEMKSTFLTKSDILLIRPMSEDVFDILKACEKGAWSAAVAMISYPWNAAWASVHSPAERHEIIRLLEEEAISSYHQLKVRTGTHLEALCAGVVIVIALADAAKIHKAWFLLCELHTHARQFGLHRKGAVSPEKGPLEKVLYLGPRNMRKTPAEQDGFSIFGDDLWWSIIRLICALCVGVNNTDNPINLRDMWTPWPSNIGGYFPPPCRMYTVNGMQKIGNSPPEDYHGQVARLKSQMLLLFTDYMDISQCSTTGHGPRDFTVPLPQQADPQRYAEIIRCFNMISSEVRSEFEPVANSPRAEKGSVDLVLILAILEAYLFITEDQEQRNDRVVAVCLRVSGLLAALRSTKVQLAHELDLLLSAIIHVLRLGCGQEISRYERYGLTKDAVYEALVIAANDIDQLMLELSTSCPMAAANFSWYRSSAAFSQVTDAKDVDNQHIAGTEVHLRDTGSNLEYDEVDILTMGPQMGWSAVIL